MTLREFLESHPGEALDLMLPEGRVLLEPKAIQSVLDGKPVIVSGTSPKKAARVSAEDLLGQIVCSSYRTRCLWRLATTYDPEIRSRVRHHPGMMRWRYS
ncbi:hypothetical protein [uncultured Dysosmobacter sp.]|uniref:hypothetical protein n=1 Tax=uncultured Dysosmobacter sp. TaxID=2591384 RepID=UPI00262F2EF1|nr:hypothetical protein [uncultured Dysosmobacter sp.]